MSRSHTLLNCSLLHISVPCIPPQLQLEKKKKGKEKNPQNLLNLNWHQIGSIICQLHIPKTAPNKYLSAKPWDLNFHPPAWCCMLKCCWSLESFLTACILSLESAMPFPALYVLPCFLITESFHRLSCRVCEREVPHICDCHHKIAVCFPWQMCLQVPQASSSH